MASEKVFRNDLKTIGLISLHEENVDSINSAGYKQYIKVLLLSKGTELQVDLAEYSVKQPSLFFVSPNQHLHIKKLGKEEGHFIFYNRNFYCIQIHDEEVACNGLLFSNIYNMPMVELDNGEIPFFSYIFGQITDEFGLNDTSLEEMLRTYLKQLFIKSARLWKKQNLDKELTEQNSDLEFFRKFTLLVDEHYKEKHHVADYAELLFMAPKTISHKFKRLNLPQPNDVIKNRILLEAKRLLVHTNLTAKEVGYELGYEDPAYFSRLFVQKSGETPSAFRAKFLAIN
ncbi:helix-turn-helix transcriptional regulator [Sphingobacterium siyangense]|uniref:helix-turn-helix domain-containing protein n=1 Tax=Sphingobacterium TaxID=28453 RepID=UPI0009585B9B|nr:MULTISPECIES: helix-turn-helix domain-containing protein [Sphingobacterium]APU96270.1 AraC family transcriptional regulator [Sphingobacterium sp. B29]UQA76647.1 helix-turn-helix transcriptional regulator [Sphingobacterium siyangense]